MSEEKRTVREYLIYLEKDEARVKADEVVHDAALATFYLEGRMVAAFREWRGFRVL